MTLYSEKPDLKLKKVTTKTGEIEYLKNCKKFENEFYLRSDCVQIGSIFYPKTHPGIEKNWETGEFFIKNNGLRVMRGIVAVENDVVKYGYFTPNPNNNVPCYNEETKVRETLLHSNVVTNCKHFVENVSEGVIYYNTKYTENHRKQYSNIQNCYDWTVKKYNLEDNASEYKKKNALYQHFDHEKEKPAPVYAKYLNYTFGIEFEVSRGFIPDYMQNRHGLVICRDGSIDGGGPEFVTVPLQGAKGVTSTIQLCEFAKNRVLLDMSCSTHQHFGGFPSTDKKAMVALYILSYSIQEELFKMLPPYKKHWEGFKKKNYCKFLDVMGLLPTPDMDDKTINKYYDSIVSFLSDFKLKACNYQPGMNHPSGAKWDIENRKYWINLVNMLFSSRNTVEFRAHQATFNPVKTINWLFINNAILSYAQRYQERILTHPTLVSFKDVLNYYRDTSPNEPEAVFISEYLINYYDHCCGKFSAAFRSKDYTCAWDLVEDPTFDFKLHGKNLIM